MYNFGGGGGGGESCRNLIKTHLHAELLDLKAGMLSAVNQQVFIESLIGS